MFLAASFAALLVAAVTAAVFALNQQQVAQERFRESERMRLASQGQNALDRGESGDLAALLAMQSLAQGYSSEADMALTRALRRGFPRQRYLGHTDIASNVDFSPDGHMDFATEAFNVISMDLPIQDAFIDVGDDQVMRPTVLDAETLAMPVYRTAVEVPLDFFEPPFDTGPYPKGEPMNMTLGEYVGVVGYGTYTPHGDTATVELDFERLVPGGVYTMWCNILNFVELSMIEAPCISPGDQYYRFIAGEDGRAQITMILDAFPPSTDEAVYEIAVGYHSNGLTYGPEMGKHGQDAHGIMFYDFMPPGQ